MQWLSQTPNTPTVTQRPASESVVAAGTQIPVQLKLLHRATFVLERAAFALQLIRHVPAVFTVLVAGVSALQFERGGGGRALAAAELLTGAWVLAVVSREVWHRFGPHAAKAFAKPDPHAASHDEPRVDIAGIAAAALGYVEAWHQARAEGHFELLSPIVLGATLSLLLSFGARRAIRKRGHRSQLYIAVTPTIIAYKAGPRTSWRAEWTDVAAVECAEDEIAVRLQNGQRRVLRAAAFFDGEALLAETWAAIATNAPAHLVSAIGAGPGQAQRCANANS